MPHLLTAFELGAVVMACAVAGVFFLRFWRKTRDRLFVIFAIAFWLLGLNWFLLAIISRDEATTAIFYVLRLLAFILIIFAIIDKNRPRRSAPRSSGT